MLAIKGFYLNIENNAKLPAHYLPLAILLFCVIINISACTSFLPNTKNDTSSNDKRYFDLIAYFEQQSRQLAGKKVEKIAVLNGKREAKELSAVDWQRELSVFANSDINKPAYRDSYDTDSTFIGDTLRVTYTTRQPALRTQTISLDILSAKQLLVSISIKNQVNNPLYALSEQLLYDNMNRYSIKSRQKVLWLQSNDFDIEAKIK